MTGLVCWGGRPACFGIYILSLGDCGAWGRGQPAEQVWAAHRGEEVDQKWYLKP